MADQLMMLVLFCCRINAIVLRKPNSIFATQNYAGRRHLRSANTRQLIIPWKSTSYGDRSFAVHGPVIWNHLPHNLWSTNISLTTFRERLKTFLFDADM